MVGVNQGVLASRLSSLFSKIGPAMGNISWKGCILILFIQYPTSRNVDFSPNINGLDIVGPRLSDKSFHDLPAVLSVDELDED